MAPKAGSTGPPPSKRLVRTILLPSDTKDAAAAEVSKEILTTPLTSRQWQDALTRPTIFITAL